MGSLSALHLDICEDVGYCLSNASESLCLIILDQSQADLNTKTWEMTVELRKVCNFYDPNFDHRHSWP